MGPANDSLKAFVLAAVNYEYFFFLIFQKFSGFFGPNLTNLKLT